MPESMTAVKRRSEYPPGRPYSISERLPSVNEEGEVDWQRISTSRGVGALADVWQPPRTRSSLPFRISSFFNRYAWWSGRNSQPNDNYHTRNADTASMTHPQSPQDASRSESVNPISADTFSKKTRPRARRIETDSGLPHALLNFKVISRVFITIIISYFLFKCFWYFRNSIALQKSRKPQDSAIAQLENKIKMLEKQVEHLMRRDGAWESTVSSIIQKKLDSSSSHLSALEDKIQAIVQEKITSIANATTRSLAPEKMAQIEDLYNIVLRDGNGEVDWAAESVGAQIVQKETEKPINTGSWFTAFYHQHFANQTTIQGKSPLVVLQPDLHVGNCFAFAGAHGRITVQLPATILITSVGIEHITLDMNHNPGSTPRKFRVYANPDLRWPQYFNVESHENTKTRLQLIQLKKKMESSRKHNLSFFDKLAAFFSNSNIVSPEKILIGDFEYTAKSRLQTFNVKLIPPSRRITFEFYQNYGADFTCVYRIRVHGDPMKRI